MCNLYRILIAINDSITANFFPAINLFVVLLALQNLTLIDSFKLAPSTHKSQLCYASYNFLNLVGHSHYQPEHLGVYRARLIHHPYVIVTSVIEIADCIAVNLSQSLYFRLTQDPHFLIALFMQLNQEFVDIFFIPSDSFPYFILVSVLIEYNAPFQQSSKSLLWSWSPHPAGNYHNSQPIIEDAITTMIGTFIGIIWPEHRFTWQINAEIMIGEMITFFTSTSFSKY